MPKAQVTTAVIPAAGWGTRFLPATKTVPKELLPLYDKAMVQMVVEEAVSAGIRRIILVTSSNKLALEQFFDRSLELEQFLEQKGNTALLDQVRAVSSLATFVFVRQPEQRGLGHAVLMADGLTGDGPFAVMLPDDVFEVDASPLRPMMRLAARRRASVLALERVPREEVSRYGIVAAEPAGGRGHRIKGIVEKPAMEQAPSDLGSIGRYVLMPEVFEHLRKTRPGAGGEVQLVDAIDALLRRQPVYGYEFQGHRYDGGTPMGLLKAWVEVGLTRPDVRREFLPWLRARLKHQP